jgi:hypothetical protein
VSSNDDANINGTFAVRRISAKRTLPWDLEAGELDLVSSPPPQAEDNPASRKLRLEEPLPITTDEADRKLPSPDLSLVPPPLTADGDSHDANDDRSHDGYATE